MYERINAVEIFGLKFSIPLVLKEKCLVFVKAHAFHYVCTLIKAHLNLLLCLILAM